MNSITIYSKTAEHAIRALTYMAQRPIGSQVSAREVSQKTKVPYAYISKTFQALVGAGILTSRRGSKGGFSLGVKPDLIHLIDVIKALDHFGESPFSQCVMGLSVCGETKPCPLHSIWSASRDKMTAQLEKNTLQDMAELMGSFPSVPKRRRGLSNRMREVFA